MTISTILDAWLESICSPSHTDSEPDECRYLPENEFRQLCSLAAELLAEECNVQPVSSPVTVCGDIHGQFYDLKALFVRGGGTPPLSHYVFLGDFVDRGYYSLETITWLLALKVRHPQHITLLRGNHETRDITRVYGFYDECLAKYGNATPWKHCCRVFELLTVAALIDDHILCVHGGLSPSAPTLDHMMLIERRQEMLNKGAFSDIVWSDPDEHLRGGGGGGGGGWKMNPRGAGFLFGRGVAEQFLHVNGLSLLCRAHQLVQEGIKFMFGQRLVTVWSAPNYCYRCGNEAAILRILNEAGEREELKFGAMPARERRVPERVTVPYFL